MSRETAKELERERGKLNRANMTIADLRAALKSKNWESAVNALLEDPVGHEETAYQHQERIGGLHGPPTIIYGWNKPDHGPGDDYVRWWPDQVVLFTRTT